MENLIIQPRSDSSLEWNPITKQYQLTLEYVKSLWDGEPIPYKNDAITKRRIKDTSQRVYSYFSSHCATVNRGAVRLILNRTEEGRKFLIEILKAQMLADMEYGYNDLVRRPVVNASSGQMGDRDEYRRNAISIEAELIIEDSVNYVGINLTYMGMFPCDLLNLARRYED